MTVPAAGEFEVQQALGGTLGVRCPTCGYWEYAAGYTIRDLIGAASEHARTAHARTEVNA